MTKILVVDDEPDIRSLLGAVLQSKGFEVVTARMSPTGSAPFGGTGRPGTLKSLAERSPVRGRKLIAPTACTPGSAARRASSARKNAICAVSPRYFRVGIETSAINA